MYALVRYDEDGIYYVSNSKNITKYKGITKAKYCDGHKYVASIIAKNNDKNMLLELKENILQNVPHILCEKVKFGNGNRKEKTNKINKSCDNKTEDRISENSDNKTEDRISENSGNKTKDNIIFSGKKPKVGNQDKTEARKENCGNQIANFPTYLDNTILIFDENGKNINTFPCRDCDSKTDYFLHNDIDKPIISIDENGNQDKTKARKTNCDNQITDLLTSFDVENEESGSEYLPSEDDQNSNNNDDDETQQIQKSIASMASISSLDATKMNNGTSICDDEKMHVETSNAKNIKQNYCIFCSKLQTQLVRHLEKVHRNESDVKKFAALPKRNPERRKIIDTLRKMAISNLIQTPN
ncbi:MATH and LRR domain-containing protein PFE0570w-like [Nylanderia fulva]|uniref:MATH and LRR domain-containing protein PFE0570w-like n=1 Tax=Nylanderia fulva TaxID=613905 RepID=UPI0010FB0BB1|nr:MATH and LRR domain-containing protein PFE0570w-like [Nylanderia fulva]